MNSGGSRSEQKQQGLILPTFWAEAPDRGVYGLPSEGEVGGRGRGRRGAVARHRVVATGTSHARKGNRSAAGWCVKRRAVALARSRVSVPRNRAGARV